MTESRTQKMEVLVAGLCGVPLTAETVFLRPERRDGGIEKEVCDILLALRSDAILFSLKTREKPDERSGPRVTSWCAKHSRKAVGQLGGAIRVMRDQSFWCDHPRRRRVDFSAGSLHARHAVAILESLEPDVVLGGSGTPEEVTDTITRDLSIPEKELNEMLPSG